MNIKETKLLMDLCQQMFGYIPNTVAEFSAFTEYLSNAVDE